VTTFERILRLRLLGLRERLLARAAATGGGQQARHEVEEIDAALARLTDGTFGVCEGCGGALGHTRLTAEPAARFCIACSSKPPIH
jgi:RNA polymerase-binding transcription factor DksA